MLVSTWKATFVVMGVLGGMTIGGYLAANPAQAGPSKPQVIVLTQTGCQFVEPEGGDKDFHTTSAADCKAINARTAEQRLAAAKTLELKPGKYIFRVINKNVPYELGFYLRGASLISRLKLPKVSGGGILLGMTKDFEVKLKEGGYLYSCPLNPTPNYRLVVKR
ncbi:MAG: hypothetical protein ACE5JS_02620 [Nitrospinota bacterium]